jgi:hypothetical protein
MGHTVSFGAYGARIFYAIFFMLVWAQCASHRKRARTCYAELVFFHLVQSVDHLLHSGSSKVQNVDALFFMHEWTHRRSHKKRTGTCYVKLVFLHLV